MIRNIFVSSRVCFPVCVCHRWGRGPGLELTCRTRTRPRTWAYPLVSTATTSCRLPCTWPWRSCAPSATTWSAALENLPPTDGASPLHAKFHQLLQGPQAVHCGSDRTGVWVGLPAYEPRQVLSGKSNSWWSGINQGFLRLYLFIYDVTVVISDVMSHCEKD